MQQQHRIRAATLYGLIGTLYKQVGPIAPFNQLEKFHDPF